ncbi:PCNA-associated factor histone like domain [Popillia japonica]|uniref:PCNA-associated factor histone like domain n=1 Tax=Popillia japonica TaxID=7064 RepID=A0AAW1IXY1_POPJA
MVRTAATAIRASGGKSSKAVRKSTVTNNIHGSSSSDRHTVGGNPVHPRETPSWQRPITNFFSARIEEAHPASNLQKQVQSEEVKEFAREGNPTASTKDRIVLEEVLQENNSNKENVTANQVKNNIEAFESVPSQSGIDKKRKLESDGEISKASKKKPNSHFYEHLEEIEKFVNC